MIQKKRRIDSLMQNVVFNATSGKKKSRKHLELGINLKSFTGSRRILEIMNRFDHCASYHTVEEVETTLTAEAKKEGKLLPQGLKPFRGSRLGTAWDNFDRFVETLNGKDTLHDTVRIAFQRRPEDPSFSQAEEARTYIALKRKRKRAYDPTGIEIEPYRKKLKLLQEFSTAEEIKKAEESVKLLLIESKSQDIR